MSEPFDPMDGWKLPPGWPINPDYPDCPPDPGSHGWCMCGFCARFFPPDGEDMLVHLPECPDRWRFFPPFTPPEDSGDEPEGGTVDTSPPNGGTDEGK